MRGLGDSTQHELKVLGEQVVHTGGLSHNCKRQAKTRGFRRVRALERTSRARRLMRTRLSVYAAKRLRVMRCLLSECNCSLFVGLTHAGRSKTCVELGRETLKTTPTTIQFFSRED